MLTWGWDYIELAPLLSLGGGVFNVHSWALGFWGAASLSYLALLQLSRTALLSSVHHLSPPTFTGELVSAASCFTARESALFCTASLLPFTALYLGIWVSRSRENLSLPWNRTSSGPCLPRPSLCRGSFPARLHLLIGAVSLLALNPAWSILPEAGSLAWAYAIYTASCLPLLARQPVLTFKRS